MKRRFLFLIAALLTFASGYLIGRRDGTTHIIAAIEPAGGHSQPDVFYADQAATRGFTGYAALGVRDDIAATGFPSSWAHTNGDYAPILVDAHGYVLATCMPQVAINCTNCSGSSGLVDKDSATIGAK
jgi:hypothetical protein